jgi:hypothetical protein
MDSSLGLEAANILFYAGLVYLILSFADWPRRIRK